jgi:hypothetical protein
MQSIENYEKIYQQIQAKLMDATFKNTSKKSEQDFTRKRKLPFEDLMIFIMRSACKTLSVEVEQFFQKISQVKTPPSKQSVSKARMKISHEGFCKINDVILTGYYEETYRTYKGFRLLAADGTMLQLPATKAVTGHFGKNNRDEKQFTCGWSMTIYDVLNEIVVDARLHPYGRSEREYLCEQLSVFRQEGKQRKDLIIADRGLPSLSLMVRLLRDGYDFVLRYNGNQFLREFREFYASAAKEEIISVNLRAPGRRQDDGKLQELIANGVNPQIALRVVKVPLKAGQTEYLVTSVLDSTLLSRSDLKLIYGKRWSIEEAFKTMKNTMEIENFSGKVVETVLQEYHSKIAVFNLHSVLVQEAQKELDEKIKKQNGLKYHKYRINKNVSYGLVRERITELFECDDGDWGKAYDYLLELVQRNPIPVIPNRQYDRKKKYCTKYSPNKRRAM